MEIIINYDKPSDVFLDGYKAYFYRNYLKGIIVNCILLILSILCKHPVSALGIYNTHSNKRGHLKALGEFIWDVLKIEKI